MAVCSHSASSNTSLCLCQTFTTHLFLPILYVAIFLTGIFGNILSLWIFGAKISGKSPTHIYLINLGISNMMLCLSMPFIAFYYALGTTWLARSFVCQLAINVLTPVLHTNIGVSMIILTWLAMSRFATLIQHGTGPRPNRCIKFLPGVFFSKLRNATFALGVCLGTWAFVATGIIPSVVIYSLKETEKVSADEEACYSLVVEVGESGSQAFAIVGIIVFFLCLLVVLSAYVAVIRHFYRSRNNSAISDKHRVYSRVFRNIVVIQIVLVVCLLPYHIYKAVFIHLAKVNAMPGEHPSECHPMSIYVEIKNVLVCLASLRCSTDPIMYYLLDHTFRKYTKRLFRGSPKTQDSQSSKTMLENGQSACSKSPMTLKVNFHPKDPQNGHDVTL
ncbi:probable G-protein coupled receptor 82 [Hoplias malabaricus]|uniref:probable G-protein coupled receptor 82 n=1 Tax=Hoplias malabaricus TaxID=27720 RepID=UPI0034628302